MLQETTEQELRLLDLFKGKRIQVYKINLEKRFPEQYTDTSVTKGI